MPRDAYKKWSNLFDESELNRLLVLHFNRRLAEFNGVSLQQKSRHIQEYCRRWGIENHLREKLIQERPFLEEEFSEIGWNTTKEFV